MSNPADVYTDKFYERQSTDSLRSARIVLEQFFQFHHPLSMVDIGCGVGTWLRAARSLGVPDVIGVDGHTIEGDGLLIERDRYVRTDFSKEWPVFDRRFSLAISVEVGEHLPAARATGFVETLTRCADVVLFSAAIPGQGGRHHVNEQFPSYWIPLFASFGYRCFDAIRPLVWHQPDVAVWYRQNLLVFSRVREFPGERPTPEAYDLVHPDMWLDPRLVRRRVKQSLRDLANGGSTVARIR